MKRSRITKSEMCGNPRLQIHLPDSRPSWKRYGKGVANLEATFYARANDGSGVVGLVCSETALADRALEQKRDVTRDVHIDLDRPAAAALLEGLAEMLGYTVRENDPGVHVEPGGIERPEGYYHSALEPAESAPFCDRCMSHHADGACPDDEPEEEDE